MKLTKNQKAALENVTRNGRVYVGKYSPDVYRTYRILVGKGILKESGSTGNGTYFIAA